MTSSSNRILDEIAKLTTDAASVAQGFKKEAETAVKAQIERLIADMDLVSREEFDAVKTMAANARAENDELKQELNTLKTLVEELQARKPARRAAAKK